MHNDILDMLEGWIFFTQEALKDSRPMTEWERKAAAEFLWSQFDA